MIANYASSVDTRKWAAKKIAGDEEEMGTWEKVVFGVVFFFSVGALLPLQSGERSHFADANDRAGYNSWAKRFKQ